MPSFILSPPANTYIFTFDTLTHTHNAILQDTLSAFGELPTDEFPPGPFTVDTDVHLVRDPETLAIMMDRATAADGKAKFLDEFEKVSLVIEMRVQCT